MAKAPAKKAKRTAKPRLSKAALEQAKNEAATVMDPQTGQEVIQPEKPTKAAIEKQKAAAAEQFAEADALAMAALSRQIRGY